MATAATATTATPAVKVKKEKKEQVALHERMKDQLNTAALRKKISVEHLKELEAHIQKLIGFVSVA